MLCDGKIDEISNSIISETFYNNYVKKRIPVVINGLLIDEEWRGSKSWIDINYLKKKAGDQIVQVEIKKEGENGFGKGSVRHIEFSRFLDDLKHCDDSYTGSSMYLTTQELNYSDIDGKPDLVSAPVTCLLSDIPNRPAIMGNLIPQNVNLWMGSTSPQNKTSSGLHHDYHDNLYILLRGTKRFLLIPPSCAADMYTVGTIEKVHPNGRINYSGQLPTLADGSAVKSHIALKASSNIDEAAIKLEKKILEKLEKGEEIYDHASDLSELENEIDNAMEELLDAEMDGDDDDYTYEEDDDEDDEDCEDEQLNKIMVAAKSHLSNSQISKTKINIPNFDADQDLNHSNNFKKHKTEESNNPNKKSPSQLLSASSGDIKTSNTIYPDNFSKVRETEMSEEYIKENFPNYYKCKAQHGIVVELHENQMLYLPAGWFHEVYSSGSLPSSHIVSTQPDSDKPSSKLLNQNHQQQDTTANIINNLSLPNNHNDIHSKPSCIHMALNYWFHPPDGDSYEKPYQSNFWYEDWISRKSKLMP